jgi:hypothetical protein
MPGCDGCKAQCRPPRGQRRSLRRA